MSQFSGFSFGVQGGNKLPSFDSSLKNSVADANQTNQILGGLSVDKARNLFTTNRLTTEQLSQRNAIKGRAAGLGFGFDPNSGQFQRTETETELLGRAFEFDRQNLQDAADENFNLQRSIADEFAQGLVRGGKELRDVGSREANRLRTEADTFKQEFNDFRDETLSQFSDTSAQLAQTQLKGLNAQYRNRRTEIENNPNLTTAQKGQLLGELDRATSDQRTDVASNLGAQYIQQKSQLRTALSGQTLNAQQLRQNLITQASTLESSSVSAALELEIGGLTTLSDMIRLNPRTIFGRAAGIAQILSLNSQPRAGGGGFIGSNSGGSSGENDGVGAGMAAFFNKFQSKRNTTGNPGIVDSLAPGRHDPKIPGTLGNILTGGQI